MIRRVRIDCTECGRRHVDRGEWATRPHKTHLCEYCGNLWQPYNGHSYGVADEGPRLEVKDGRFYLANQFLYFLPSAEFRLIRVPAGYQTNFASVPWWARWLVSPVDRHLITAAIVHDYLVGEFGDVPNFPAVVETPHGKERVDWWKAAQVFRDIAEQEGAKRWKRTVVYVGVMLNGFIKWFAGEI